MAVEIHKESIYRRYYASICSWAFFFTIVVWFIIVFLPLIIAYNSKNFFLKENVCYEQPSVIYRYTFISEIYGLDSSSPRINQLYESNLRVPVFSSIELDDNNDGIVDRFQVNFKMPLASTESIYGMNIMFYQNVKVSNCAKYIYDAISYVSYDSAIPMSNLFIDGDLIIRQSAPFNAKGGFKTPYANDNLIDGSALSADDFSFANILEESSSRNYSILFNPYYEYFERSTIFGGVNQTDKSLQLFNCTITMRIKEQPLRYSPLPAESLKNAWIQYVAYLIVIVFLMDRLKSFVYRHQLLHAYSMTDVLLEKLE